MSDRPQKIPNGWNRTRLGDALSGIDAGVSPRALARPARADELGVLKVSAVTWNEFRPYENKALPSEFDAMDCPRVRRGDLLLSRANTAKLLAAPVIAQADYPNLLLSDKTLRLVANREVGHAPYLLHVLRTRLARRYFESHATGTSGSMRNVSQATIQECPILLPPLDEQRRIAAILDQSESLRAKRRHALASIRELPQAIFLDRFGDQRHESAHRTAALGDVAEVVSGVAKGRKFNGEQPARVPYLRVANVQAGFLDLSEIKLIEALPGEVAELRLKRGDVVLTEGGDVDKLGRGAIWKGEVANCIHQNHVFRVRVNPARLHPQFFHEYLQTDVARAYFLRCAKRTTNLASINMTQLRRLPVPLPSLALQQSFATQVAATEQLMAVQKASLVKLDALFASLQHRAFRGEL